MLDDISATPYFSVRILPGGEDLDISKPRLKEIVSGHAVRLRGWDFPSNFPHTTYTDSAFIGSCIEFDRHMEVWRLYASGQFVYFGRPWDIFRDLQDRMRADFERNIITAATASKESVIGVFSFVGMIYTITEFHLWASRLLTALGSGDGALQIAMHHIDGWVLASGEPLSFFHRFCQARVDVARLMTPKASALLSDPIETANVAARELFDFFGWDAESSGIRDWQENLISGRFAH